MKSRIFTARDTYYNTLPVPCNNVRSDNPVGLASILTEGVSMVSQPPYRAFLFSPSQRLRDHAPHPFPTCHHAVIRVTISTDFLSNN
jgi:hypothetical protein